MTSPQAALLTATMVGALLVVLFLPETTWEVFEFHRLLLVRILTISAVLSGILWALLGMRA
jgi:hypothetical protein